MNFISREIVFARFAIYTFYLYFLCNDVIIQSVHVYMYQ